MKKFLALGLILCLVGFLSNIPSYSDSASEEPEESMAFHDPYKPYKHEIDIEFLTHCSLTLSNGIGTFRMSGSQFFIRMLQRDEPGETHETGLVLHKPNFHFHWPQRSVLGFNASVEYTYPAHSFVGYYYNIGLFDPPSINNIGSKIHYRGTGILQLREGSALITLGKRTWVQHAPWVLVFGRNPK
jgi:hypothetical protein